MSDCLAGSDSKSRSKNGVLLVTKSDTPSRFARQEKTLDDIPPVKMVYCSLIIGYILQDTWLFMVLGIPKHVSLT